MGGRILVAFVVLCAAFGGTAAAEESPAANERRARLIEVARALPVVDTTNDDCPNFNLKCRAFLQEGPIQVEVRYRKWKQFEILGTRPVDDSPIACWSERRLIVFEPSTPFVMVTENLNMEFMLQGSFSRFCNCLLQYRFGQERTCVRVDVPSMLLAAAGDLREEGSTAQTTRLQISDTEGRRLAVEHRPNLPASSTLITYHDPSGMAQKATIELEINPEDDAEIVKRPSVKELEAVTKVVHANARLLSQIGILGTAENQSKALSRQLALMVPKLQKVGDGKQLDWKAIKVKQKDYGGRLKPLLIARQPLTADEEARRAAVLALAKKLPVLDTKQADCPRFSIRGRMHSENLSRDLILRHVGGNELEFVALTVPDGLPFLACAAERGLAFDPVKPQVSVLENTRMQWTIEGGDDRRSRFMFAFASNKEKEFEQFVKIDMCSMISVGEKLEDMGSTPDVIRLRATSFYGARTYLEFRPRLAQPTCSFRMVPEGDDVSDAEAELTINHAEAGPLVVVPARDVIERVVPVQKEFEGLMDIAEYLKLLFSCVFANGAPFDRDSRELYATIDPSPPDWEVVRANQLRIGRQLKELLSTTTPEPTPDDTPISPQFASDETGTAR